MLKISTAFFVFILIGLVCSLAVNFYFFYTIREQNRVIRVVDGDSLDLKDGRRIRLLAIDAPENGRCMSEEARNRLKQLAEGKILQVKNIVIDDYGRILANVFTNGAFINKIMLEEELSRFIYVKSPYYDELKLAAQKAKIEAKGIYSPLCRTSSQNDCLIKGNIRNAEKVYHLPNCDNYDQVIIDTSYGDQWFCTEKEALIQGFRKAKGCFGL